MALADEDSGTVPVERAPQPGSPSPTGAVSDLEAAMHAFPAVLGLDGKKLADGDYTQTVEGSRLRFVFTYNLSPQHRIHEKGAFRLEPKGKLVQEQWSWGEWRAGELERYFEIDLRTGKATSQKRTAKELKHWSETLKIEPGRTFAGCGFIFALKVLGERVMKGGKMELETVAFCPKPRIVPVEISYKGVDEIEISGQSIKGNRFSLHPRIPLVARPFVEVHDERIWLTLQPPFKFLRWEGNMVEPEDPMIRVEILPTNQSQKAEAPREGTRPTGSQN
jgi:hypothetical protein